MLIEDLRLPCQHDRQAGAHYYDRTGNVCRGSRVPTRTELIEALGGRPVVVMGGLSPAIYLADKDDEPDGYIVEAIGE